MTRGRDHNTAHLVAQTIEEARAQWIEVFSRDRADLGPNHAAQAAAEDIERYGPQARLRPTGHDAATPHSGPRRPSEPIPTLTTGPARGHPRGMGY